MSYCRFSDNSDVYMYLNVGGWVSCCGCGLAEKLHVPWRMRLTKRWWMWVASLFGLLTNLIEVVSATFIYSPGFKIQMKLLGKRAIGGPERAPDPQFQTFLEALDHLATHVMEGDMVPETAFASLKDEIQTGKLPSEVVANMDI